MDTGARQAEIAPCSMGELVRYFLRLGALGFGGPIALPSFVMVVALAALYVRYGGLSWMRGAFYGVAAGVIAIIARSAVKLASLTLKKDALLWALFAITGVVTAVTESEIVWLFLGSGAVAMLVKAPPRLGRRAAMGVFPPLLWKATQNPSLKAFVGGVTASAAGAIAGAAFVLGRRAIVDVPALVIALVVLGALLKVKKLPEPLLILAAGVAGIAVKKAGLG